jgi:hypothetical protein
MTEVFELLTEANSPEFLPHKLVYANMLGEVGLIDKAKAYVESIASRRDSFGDLKSNLFFISHLRFLNEKLSNAKTWKTGKPAEETERSTATKNFFSRIPAGSIGNYYYTPAAKGSGTTNTRQMAENLPL